MAGMAGMAAFNKEFLNNSYINSPNDRKNSSGGDYQ